MKSSKPKLTVGMICLATLRANVTYGQASGDKKPADWPRDQDAVISAKKNHKILLENDSVRVLEVTILPGEKEAVHHHQWPGVLYVMEGEDFIDRDGEGNVIFDSRKIPSFHSIKRPKTSWTGPQGPHSIENLSKTQAIRIIRVEIKK